MMRQIVDLSDMPPLEGDEEKNVDLSNMPPLEGNEEAVKSEPEETVAERVKLNPQKRKKTGTGIKILTPSKLLTRHK